MRLLLAVCLALTASGCGALRQAGPGSAGQGAFEASLIHRLPCGPRRQLVEFLIATWAQRPVAQGLALPGGLVAQASVIEVLATADGSAWTAIVTAPTGVSCVLAGGEAWQPLADFGASQRH